MAAPDPAALDAAAAPHAARILPHLVSPDDARVSPEIRNLVDMRRSRRALERSPAIAPSGNWRAIDERGQAGAGHGLVALIAWLSGASRDRAAIYLAELLTRIGAMA